MPERGTALWAMLLACLAVAAAVAFYFWAFTWAFHAVRRFGRVARWRAELQEWNDLHELGEWEQDQRAQRLQGER